MPSQVFDNPDTRNESVTNTLQVRVYFKTGKEWIFPARDINSARDIGARVTREGAWLVYPNGTEEYYPITEIHKCKIEPCHG